MKKIIIYGGTSLISIHLINLYIADINEIVVFVRNKKKFLNLCNEFINNFDFNKKKIIIIQIDIINIKNNLKIIKNFNNNFYDGLIFLVGSTGDPKTEFENYKLCETNYKINLLHPVFIINSLTKKLKSNSFICVFTSVAGIRGRNLRLFYCSAKAGLISYLSGLRQKLENKNILVINFIAGYMSTSKFKYDSHFFLISNPKNIALKVYKSIQHKKEIVYSSFAWFLISNILKLIPEKIFKKLNF
jgi:short-subunit dehydrogenase